MQPQHYFPSKEKIIHIYGGPGLYNAPAIPY